MITLFSEKARRQIFTAEQVDAHTIEEIENRLKPAASDPRIAADAKPDCKILADSLRLNRRKNGKIRYRSQIQLTYEGRRRDLIGPVLVHMAFKNPELSYAQMRSYKTSHQRAYIDNKCHHHLCGNHWCCNPDHIVLESNRRNIQKRREYHENAARPREHFERIWKLWYTHFDDAGTSKTGRYINAKGQITWTQMAKDINDLYPDDPPISRTRPPQDLHGVITRRTGHPDP